MTIKFRRDYAKLKQYVERVDAQGSWRGLQHGGKQFRSDKGAILNWWEGTGKIAFQGHGVAAVKFEQAFLAIAMRKGRLMDEFDKDLRILQHENETLRALIADVILENARLKDSLEGKRR
jgi:hypothetical protein